MGGRVNFQILLFKKNPIFSGLTPPLVEGAKCIWGGGEVSSFVTVPNPAACWIMAKSLVILISACICRRLRNTKNSTKRQLCYYLVEFWYVCVCVCVCVCTLPRSTGTCTECIPVGTSNVDFSRTRPRTRTWIRGFFPTRTLSVLWSVKIFPYQYPYPYPTFWNLQYPVLESINFLPYPYPYSVPVPCPCTRGNIYSNINPQFQSKCN